MSKLIPALILIVLSSSAVAENKKGQPVRDWVDNTGTFTTRAKLVAVDQETQLVTLRLESGETAQVPFRRFSAKDREYLNPVNQPDDDAATVKIAGVRWFTKMSEAEKAAAGKPTREDDKPILCFRVLGNVRGFM